MKQSRILPPPTLLIWPLQEFLRDKAMNLRHLEKLTVTLMVKKFEAFRQPEGSLL
jgi:hypothetical protein